MKCASKSSLKGKWKIIRDLLSLFNGNYGLYVLADFKRVMNGHELKCSSAAANGFARQQ